MWAWGGARSGVGGARIVAQAAGISIVDYNIWEVAAYLRSHFKSAPIAKGGGILVNKVANIINTSIGQREARTTCEAQDANIA